ncbi:2-amino-4-hydroxy-6-hydroxymethyldihydropteridine diphosphokinase [OM182 bacterium]|jgi:2-amino-4-hydroxy-6-hydroxymethyldihydropteridine diphosphokinase|nr:2-amino-4-hydroxy-6-hydroxymethyldihydropteridine diphosphokinase [OM182 bacterium]
MTKTPSKIESIIALGSNIPSKHGRSARLLAKALEKLGHISEEPPEVSPLFSTRPEGLEPGAPNFLNGVAIITLDEDWSPIRLLRILKRFESELGRCKIMGDKACASTYYHSRAIDLDIITYGSSQIDLPGLIIPHERALYRSFVLEPLAELRPQMVFPGSAKTVSELKNALLSDQGKC